MKTIQTLTALLLFCSCSLNVVSQDMPEYVPTDGLIGWWGFAGNALDASGNENDGTVNGAMLTADRFSNADNAYSFNGTSDYIEVADTPDLRLAGTDFTFSFWVNINSYTNPATALLIKRSSGNLNGWMLSANGNYSYRMELKTSQGADPSIFSDSTLSLGVWHHVAIVYKQADTIDYFIDGILSTSLSSGGIYFSDNCTAPMRFGQDSNTPSGNYFINGAMDDIGIWNRALTDQEVSNLFLATISSVSTVTNIGYALYPNPVNQFISIEGYSIDHDTPYRITDINGRLMISGTTNGVRSIDISMLRAGLYFIQVGNKPQIAQRFIKT